MSEKINVRKGWIKSADGSYVPIDAIGANSSDSYTKAEANDLFAAKEDVHNDVTEIKEGLFLLESRTELLETALIGLNDLIGTGVIT